MWIELDNQRYNTLFNLNTFVKILLIDNQIRYDNHAIAKNEFE